MEDQRTKRTGASTRPHPRWSWAWPVTGARPSLSGAAGTTQRRPGDGPSGAGGSRGNPEPGPAARRTAAATD